MEKKAFELNHIVTVFHTDDLTFRAVDDVSLYVKPGEIVGLVGESGSGKSVTMLSSMQLVTSPGKVESGEVYVGGNDNILKYARHGKEMQAVRGGKVGFIFQEPMTSLDPVLTVGYQIQEAVMTHSQLTKQEAKLRSIELMKSVGIPDAEQRFSYFPQQFSGGMRQRIMIAIALAGDPDVLIADEATTALDVTTQLQLLEMLKDMAENQHIAIILVTHNLGIVARYAKRIYVMYSGQIMEEADTVTLFRSPGHPYTRALLQSVPRLDQNKEHRLIPIKGMPPNPAERPPYCPFYSNCDFACDKCREKKNELKETDPGHFVRCCLTREEYQTKLKELELNENKLTPVKTVSDKEILRVNHLSMEFSGGRRMLIFKEPPLKVLDDISLTVRQGETLGIVGESGCGKSTLARCIMRAYQPTDGTILLEGQNIEKLHEKDLKSVRKKLAMIFQDPFSSLDPRQTAGAIVGEPLIIHHLVHDRSELNSRIDELFRMVGLDPAMRNRVPHEFSGGQRQRLGIARALAAEPSVIVCDEPISALDVSIQAQIINLLEDLQHKLKLTYLFIAHDLAVVKHISDRIAVMYLGQIVELADCRELYENPMHPYTQALLSAVPIADPMVDASRTRITISGEIPSIVKRPEGCPFCTRCSYATDACRAKRPQMKMVNNGHYVACTRFA